MEKRGMIRRIHERRFYGRCPYCLTEMMSPVVIAEKYIPKLFVKPNDPIVICQKCIRVFSVVETTEDTVFDDIVTKYIKATNIFPEYIIPVYVPDYIQHEVDFLGPFNDKDYSIYAVVHKYKENNVTCENIVGFCMSYKNYDKVLKESIEKICPGFHITDDCVDFLTAIDYANRGKSLINFNDNVNSWLIDDGTYLYFKKII